MLGSFYNPKLDENQHECWFAQESKTYFMQDLSTYLYFRVIVAYLPYLLARDFLRHVPIVSPLGLKLVLYFSGVACYSAIATFPQYFRFIRSKMCDSRNE